MPVITLELRSDDALIAPWCVGTAPRPNSLPAMLLMPPRTRESCIASFMFEY